MGIIVYIMNQINILILIVSLAVLAILAINMYLFLKPKKKDDQPNQDMLVLHQRLDSFSTLINDQLEKSRQASEKATLTVHQQVQGFTQGMTQIQEGLKQMHESVKSVSSFQNIFKSPKLRGIWGEASLEAALNEYFPKDRYELQHYFKSGEAVDAVLKLPNDLLLPIDSKFNWENFEKMVNAQDNINREMFRKQFYVDVKKKIDEIASKYLLPAEGTTDWALMYIPAETVYYELINNIKEVDIAKYARTKKIQLVSPNTFALSVSAILHWFRDVQINKQTKEIMKKLDRIVVDGGKLDDEFQKLGKHIANAKSAYDDSEKRLSLMVDRVKNVIEIGSPEDEIKKIDVPEV
jgi:DNA recombination protein RmuC